MFFCAAALGLAACAGERAPESSAGSAGTGAGGSGASSSASSASGAGAGSGGSAGGSAGSAGSGSSGGSGGCQVVSADAAHALEVEPNDTPATATPLPSGKTGLAGALCPAGDKDVFAVALGGGESLSVHLGDGNGGCPSSSLPFVSVVAPGGAVIASDTGFGCVALTPLDHPALADLPPGPYHVIVENSQALPGSPYQIDIAVVPPSCGDALVQVDDGEQCDDGNAADGDGCSGACKLDGDFVSEVEPCDDDNPMPLGGAQGAVGSLVPDSDVDVFSFKVDIDGSTVSAIVSDGLGGCPYGLYAWLELRDPSGTSLIYVQGGAVEKCAFIDPLLYPSTTNLAAGNYVIRVVSADVVAAPHYVVAVEVHPPGCGDAIRKSSEQCDDGNAVSGDGCSATCKSEAPSEIEPNDDKASATPLWPGTAKWLGRLLPAGEKDWFSFTVANGANVTLSTNQPGNAGACDFDSVIHLVNAQGIELAKDDNSGPNACSKLSPANNPQLANMAAGTYYVWLDDISETPMIPAYELRIDIQ